MKNRENCAKCKHHVIIISEGVEKNGCHLGNNLSSEEMRFNFLLVNKFSDGKCNHCVECEKTFPLIEEIL